MLFNKKFDVIVSLGEDCACSSYLRRFNLQKYSYPFDWLSNADFEERINLLINNFSDFLNKEDLIPYPKINPDTENNKKYDLYQNTRNKFHYYHDFEASIPFSESYAYVYQKYSRRINRLYRQLNNAKHILFVWYSKDKTQDINVIKSAYELLNKKFSNKVSMLIIENSVYKEKYELYDKNLLVLKYDNASYIQTPKWNATMGNEKNNSKVFRSLSLKYTFTEKILNIFYLIEKSLIAIIPIKEIRHKCRNKLEYKRKHAKL